MTKEERADRKRAWYRSFYAANKETETARRRANYRRAKKAIAASYDKAKRSAYYTAHKEKEAAYRRTYSQAHKKDKAAYSHAYRLANLIASETNSRRQSHKRRARKRNAPIIENIDSSVVFERSKGICGICRMPVDLANWHLDHIIPLSRGGAHSYANVQISHPRCNQTKGASLVAQATDTTNGQCSRKPLTSRHG